MINKQSIWFVTLFSLILVLSIYYVTLNDSSLKSILDTATSQSDSSVSVSKEESSLLVALRVEEDESVLKQMNDYQEILLDANKTSAEKNEAYLSLMALNSKKEEEAKIEKKIKEGKSELLNMRMQSARGGLEKPHKISAMKKDIARMMTVLKERELGGTNENGK